jgi:hypothetical protein
MGEDGEDYFDKDCEYNEEDDYLDDDYQRVGSISWFYPDTNPGDVVTISSDSKSTLLVTLMLSEMR